MVKRLMLMVLLLGVLMAGCASTKKFPAPVRSADDLHMVAMWQAVQRELKLDPAAAGVLEHFQARFEPDGALDHFWMEFRARRKGGGEALYHVEGGAKEWTWSVVTDKPVPPSVPRRPTLEPLFQELDAVDFPRAFLAAAQPADFYMIDLHVNDAPAKNAAVARIFQQGKLRDWTPADTERFRGQPLPVITFTEMVKSGPNVYGGSRRHEYLFPQG